ncbi:MAG TPA: MFS transporter [Candidatus Acidoferrum sp.]|nr:MFS transporter [Candidatus Acidoferrum sp.]
MRERLARLLPLHTVEARRLATLFAVVYFAQGMWNLPVQTMTLVLKERGLSSSGVADFFLLSTIPWVIKPLYGLLSDFVPLFGRRRQSYFLLASALASLAGFAMALSTDHGYWRLAWLYTAMGFGLAFCDVLADAIMVETGKPRGLTGVFQSMQWASISVATLAVGVLGGHLAHTRSLHLAFVVAACFPLVSFAMVLAFLREPTSRIDGAATREAFQAIRQAARHRDLWIVAGFIFCSNFNPLFGPAFLYFQTDVLRFDQRFIGVLASLTAVGSFVGAAVYAPLSRRVPLRRLIVFTIGLSAAGTLAYVFYRGPVSAVVIDALYGVVGILIQLSLLDLAAKACPKRAEGTFFALLMSVYNGSTQLSTNVGGRLYDGLGFTPLVLISTVLTALAWLLVPLVKIERIEAAARADADALTIKA